MPIHICPVCGVAHEIHPILHDLACGRQLTCSPRCKTDFPRIVMARILAAKAAAIAAKHDRDKEATC